MSFHYRYRKQIIIGTIIAILLISLVSLLVYKFIGKKEEPEESIIVEKKKDKVKEEKEEEFILYEVDIKGEVMNPGIYSLKESSRIKDVIELAGGLTENANTTVINLSKKITDEMVIIIYSNSEVEEFKKTKEIEEQVLNKCLQKDENSLHNDACITSDDTTNIINSKISINTASKEELMTLPGIGEAKAESIIEYRNKTGPFETIEDISKVSGIGDNLFAQIKDFITT